MKLKALSLILFGVVALAFGYAGIGKIIDPEQFVSSVLTYKLFPYQVAVVVALFVPWLEVVLSVGLMVPRFRSAASWLTVGLLLLFVALVIQGRLRGLAIDCGCYGSNVLENDYQYAIKIGQNVLLIVSLWLGVLVTRIQEKRFGND